MLIIDPQKVNSISCKRFANILDRELHGNSPSIASASPEVVRCIRNTLSSVLRNMEDVQRDDTVDRLRNHVEIIDNLPQPSLMEEFVEEPAPAIAALGTLSRANDGNVSNSATKAVSNSNEESTEEEGANIQYLLQSQKDLSAKDLEMEQKTQAMLVNELSELTSLLKESTLDINRAVNVQNIQLSSMSGYAAENRDELEKQKKRMKESTTVMSTSIWTNVWLMLWVVAMFCVTYAVIRLLPVPAAYPPVCGNRVYGGHGEL